MTKHPFSYYPGQKHNLNYPKDVEQLGLIEGNALNGIENIPKKELTLKEKVTAKLSPENFQNYNGVFPILERSLAETFGHLELGGFYKQIAIYNDTNATIYIATDSAILDATHYRFRIATKQYFVSVPFNFNDVYWFLSVANANALTAKLFCYSENLTQPGQWTIT